MFHWATFARGDRNNDSELCRFAEITRIAELAL